MICSKLPTNRVKRLFDLVIVVLSVIILSPILVLIGFLVHMKIGSPVLFRQQRPGKNGQPFSLYKFRSMMDGRDEEGNPLPDEQRLTRLGRFLRATSLDELPELWNVLKGDMSIVGHKPEVGSRRSEIRGRRAEKARRH